MSDIQSDGIDSSIPLQAGRGVQQQNPLQAIGQFANIQNAINQSKLFPLQQQQMEIANQRSGLGLKSDQSSLIQQQRQLGYASLAPLLAKKGALTLDDVTSGLAGFEKSGGVSAPVLNEMQHIQLTGDPAVDDATFRAHILANAQAPAAAAGAVLPGQATIDTGTGIQPVTVGARGLPGQGAVTPAGAQVETYPSRASQLQQVTWTDSHGVTQQGTNADWAHAHSMDSLIGPASPVAGAPSPSAIPGNGAYVPKGVAPSATPASGPIPGPSPGTSENATASAMSAHVANQRAATFSSDLFPLQQAQTALANAPTGKGSQIAHDASAYIGTFAPAWVQKGLSFISPVMTADQQASYDEAKKYLTQGTLGAPGATRSNEGQAAAGAATPSVEISPQAAQLVIKGMIGLRRMEQDATLSFNKSGLPASGYDKFQTEFATKADPRAYMFDQMTPEQRNQTLSSFKDQAKRQAFISQVQRAEKNGVLSAPNAQ
jgi:hypothetical protein